MNPYKFNNLLNNVDAGTEIKERNARVGNGVRECSENSGRKTVRIIVCIAVAAALAVGAFFWVRAVIRRSNEKPDYGSAASVTETLSSDERKGIGDDGSFCRYARADG